jgi:hypothetical protein
VDARRGALLAALGPLRAPGCPWRLLGGQRSRAGESASASGGPRRRRAGSTRMSWQNDEFSSRRRGGAPPLSEDPELIPAVSPALDVAGTYGAMRRRRIHGPLPTVGAKMGLKLLMDVITHPPVRHDEKARPSAPRWPVSSRIQNFVSTCFSSRGSPIFVVVCQSPLDLVLTRNVTSRRPEVSMA